MNPNQPYSPGSRPNVPQGNVQPNFFQNGQNGQQMFYSNQNMQQPYQHYPQDSYNPYQQGQYNNFQQYSPQNNFVTNQQMNPNMNNYNQQSWFPPQNQQVTSKQWNSSQTLSFDSTDQIQGFQYPPQNSMAPIVKKTFDPNELLKQDLVTSFPEAKKDQVPPPRQTNTKELMETLALNGTKTDSSSFSLNDFMVKGPVKKLQGKDLLSSLFDVPKQTSNSPTPVIAQTSGLMSKVDSLFAPIEKKIDPVTQDDFDADFGDFQNAQEPMHPVDPVIMEMVSNPIVMQPISMEPNVPLVPFMPLHTLETNDSPQIVKVQDSQPMMPSRQVQASDGDFDVEFDDFQTHQETKVSPQVQKIEDKPVEVAPSVVSKKINLMASLNSLFDAKSDTPTPINVLVPSNPVVNETFDVNFDDFGDFEGHQDIPNEPIPIKYSLPEEKPKIDVLSLFSESTQSIPQVKQVSTMDPIEESLMKQDRFKELEEYQTTRIATNIMKRNRLDHLSIAEMVRLMSLFSEKSLARIQKQTSATFEKMRLDFLDEMQTKCPQMRILLQCLVELEMAYPLVEKMIEMNLEEIYKATKTIQYLKGVLQIYSIAKCTLDKIGSNPVFENVAKNLQMFFKSLIIVLDKCKLEIRQENGDVKCFMSGKTLLKGDDFCKWKGKDLYVPVANLWIHKISKDMF